MAQGRLTWAGTSFFSSSPSSLGVLIAAGAILVSALRQHRIDVRRTLLEARRPNLALSLADAAAGEVSSELPHRRIAF
jgi:hypothetical protein